MKVLYVKDETPTKYAINERKRDLIKIDWTELQEIKRNEMPKEVPGYMPIVLYSFKEYQFFMMSRHLKELNVTDILTNSFEQELSSRLPKDKQKYINRELALLMRQTLPAFLSKQLDDCVEHILMLK